MDSVLPALKGHGLRRYHRRCRASFVVFQRDLVLMLPVRPLRDHLPFCCPRPDIWREDIGTFYWQN